MTLDISQFKSPDDFTERLATAPKIRSPHANEDVRCRDDWIWPDVTLIKHDGKVYLVKSNLWQALAGRMFRGALYATASSVKGEIFVWMVKLSATTAVKAAEAACKGWIRVKWIHSDKGYEFKEAEGKHADPDWRFESFEQLIEAAFSGRVLDSLEQDVVKEILGLK
jgi:hypothetical protein